MPTGIDTASRDVTGAFLVANSYEFACRYILNTPGSTFDKETSYAELQEKSKAGCRVVANFEWGEKPDDTISKGQEHAGHFLQWIEDNPGVPKRAPCYFSLDQNYPAGAYHNYFTGVLRELGSDLSRSAMYGNGACARSLLKADLISLWWQSKSLSYAGNHLASDSTKWDHSGATMYQKVAAIKLQGADCDVNITQADYYGGWLLGEEDPNMAISPDDVKAILHTDGIIPNPAWRSDSPQHNPPGKNEFIALQTLLVDTGTMANAAYVQARNNASAIGAIKPGQVDVNALAQALASNDAFTSALAKKVLAGINLKQVQA